jgi:diphthamide biosynthesis protein 2
MSEEAGSVVAPALSTYQDESTFEFQQYQKKEQDRSYLGPGWNDNHDEDELYAKLNDYYSIDELVEHLAVDGDNGKKYKRITLQFPDSLVADSTIVIQQLQHGLDKVRRVKKDYHSGDHDGHDSEEEHQHKSKDNCKKTCGNCKCSDPLDLDQKYDDKQNVWILADTAYSSCCIDEVAAEHVQSDIVVHFGDACLNAIQKLPPVYVFGKPYLDIDAIIDKIKETYPNPDQKVVLMADAPYTRHLPEIYETLQKDYTNIAFADINLERANNAEIIGFHSSNIETKSNLRFSNRVFISGNEVSDEDELLSYDLFHITEPQPPHLLYLTTKFNSITIYNPNNGAVNQGPFPSLMKRYRYMHVSRTAGTIGILVNTLSLRNTTAMIKKVKDKIKEADKKSYMFVVGKPNVAKLANFESIEVWCILGCGQGGIVLDGNNEFYKPIITPYELELALDPVVSWSGKWVTEFESFLQDEEAGENEGEESRAYDDSPAGDDDEDEDDDDDAPVFNPVTGRYVSTSRPLRNVQHLEIDSVSNSSKEEGQLVKQFSRTVAIKGTVSTSAIHLQNRHWTGLGSDFNQDEDIDEEGALVEEGIGGVARGYGFDVKDAKTTQA